MYSPQGDAELRLGSAVVEPVEETLPEALAEPPRLVDAEAPEVDESGVELPLDVVDEDCADANEVDQQSSNKESGMYIMFGYSMRRACLNGRTGWRGFRLDSYIFNLSVVVVSSEPRTGVIERECDELVEGKSKESCAVRQVGDRVRRLNAAN